ncbi:MAG: homoserine dehydrogenase [Pelagibacteraceae bacterium TMED287]|nr:MAG: homoserine dehydrogenase [Pelagibacteraceae bacterium TMED287]
MNKNKKVNIAIVGLGNIGSYLYNYLKKNKNYLAKKTNTTPNIIYVSAKNRFKKRKLSIPKNKWVNKYLDITKKKNVDIIVELIGGSEGAAKNLVFSALKNKINIVTANKSLIAKHGDKLAKIAEQNKVNLEFEAAVCGGVPIVKSLKEGLVANSITKIYGVFNGTSNFILSSMDKDNLDFKEALQKAKSLGYAESNPVSDLNGEDVASKLKILTALSFNSYINNKDITVEGISKIDKTDINNANLLGYKIKLLGVSHLENKKVTQRVNPYLIKKSSYIAKIDGVLNAVIIEGKPVGETVIQGEGAGPKATTSALVSDIISIIKGKNRSPFMVSDKKRKNILFENINNKEFSAYLRIDVKDKHGVLSNITTTLAKNKVSIKRLIQNPYKIKKYSSIVIITHEVKDILLNRCINQLSKKKYLIQKPKVIRIEKL